MSSKSQSAMSGAATGAVVGSAVPVVGTVVGAVVGGVIGWFAGGDDAGDEATSAAKNQLAWDKEQYTGAKNYLDLQGARAGGAFNKGIMQLQNDPTLGKASFGTASMGQASYGTASLGEAYNAQSYDMKAYASKAYEAELDSFLAAFKEAENTNDLSLEDFNRRYGGIMDNLEKSILDVEQARLSAGGREQLMFDSDTMKANFQQKLAKTGLTRSGLSVEMEQRMNMDTQRQARAIDVNSYAQSNQLQAQGTQALNSVFAQGQNIATRDEMIAQNKGSGLLQSAMQNAQNQTNVSMQNANLRTQASSQNANNRTRVSQQNAQNQTNVSMGNAQNKTQVSMGNAANATNVSMGNAANATNVSMNNASLATNVSQQNAGILNTQNQMLAQSYMNRWEMGKGAQNAFYSGVGAPDSANLINAYSAQDKQDSADMAGAAKAAGYIYKEYKTNTQDYSNPAINPSDSGSW